MTEFLPAFQLHFFTCFCGDIFISSRHLTNSTRASFGPKNLTDLTTNYRDVTDQDALEIPPKNKSGQSQSMNHSIWGYIYIYIAIENDHLVRWFTHEKWWCSIDSIAMLVYQAGYLIERNMMTEAISHSMDISGKRHTRWISWIMIIMEVSNQKYI